MNFPLVSLSLFGAPAFEALRTGPAGFFWSLLCQQSSLKHKVRQRRWNRTRVLWQVIQQNRQNFLSATLCQIGQVSSRRPKTTNFLENTATATPPWRSDGKSAIFIFKRSCRFSEAHLWFSKMRDTRDEEGPRVPLKTILQNFLNHVENLEARKREGDDAYEKEFQVRRH